MRYPGLPKFEVIDGVRVYRVPCLRKRKDVCHTHEMASYLISALPVVLKLVRARKYDINHTHFIIPAGVLSLIVKRITKLPYVITAHGSDVPGYNPDRFRGEHKLIRPLWKAVIDGAEGVIAPTEYLKGLILRSHTAANIRVIHHGFHYERFRSDRAKESAILVVTRMLPRKGVQHFLDALRGVDLGGYEVNIVGDGPYLPTLKEMAREHDVDVHFHGWIDNESPELEDLYKKSSIFVFVSEAENFPIVLLEAMSSGLAIISVNDTGCPEVLGESAFLVPPRDPGAIRIALTQLVHDRDLRNRLGSEARLRVEREFRWETIAQKYETTYHELSSKKV